MIYRPLSLTYLFTYLLVRYFIYRTIDVDEGASRRLARLQTGGFWGLGGSALPAVVHGGPRDIQVDIYILPSGVSLMHSVLHLNLPALINE